MIKSGELRDRLTIQQATEARDSLGQAIETWETFATVWGKLTPINGRERFLSAQTRAESTYRAKIRYIAGLTAKMRISFGEKIYHITYIADDGRRRELVLDLVEGVIND